MPRLTTERREPDAALACVPLPVHREAPLLPSSDPGVGSRPNSLRDQMGSAPARHELSSPHNMAQVCLAVKEVVCAFVSILHLSCAVHARRRFFVAAPMSANGVRRAHLLGTTRSCAREICTTISCIR